MDPPTIIPWRAIGLAEIGMKRANVGDAYGAPIQVENLKGYFPAGTRYYGRTAIRSTYRVRGGALVVTYVDGQAKVLSTTSPRYRTPDGIHVGLRIRPHRCAGAYGCWRGFAFNECVDAFGAIRDGVNVSLFGRPVSEGARRVTPRSMQREGARLAGVSFGDPDVTLTCF